MGWMAVAAYLKATGSDWLARMTGPISLILLFVPLLAPNLTANYLGGSALVWIVAFVCLIVSSYRTWLLEHRVRLAEKFDPLLEDTRLLRELWDRIQYDHKDSRFISFPLSGFDVDNWEEVHKQLLRLFFWTSVQAKQSTWRCEDLGIAERPPLADVMDNQHARSALNGLGYTKLLEEQTAFLTRHRARIAG
jgi:hypothetical protein